MLPVQAVGVLVCVSLLSGKGKHKKNDFCRVTLINGNNRVVVNALVDSGNSLIEPISGKPVSVVEQTIIAGLWKEDALYRAIPYHSVGKKKGILKAYCLPELKIEIGGILKSCENVYVAVCEESVASQESESNPIRMILNPDLLDR